MTWAQLQRGQDGRGLSTPTWCWPGTMKTTRRSWRISRQDPDCHCLQLSSRGRGRGTSPGETVTPAGHLLWTTWPPWGNVQVLISLFLAILWAVKLFKMNAIFKNLKWRKASEHPLRSTCSCSCEDLNKPAPHSHSRARRLRRKDKAGISIENLSCSTSHHLMAYNSLVNLLQDRLYTDTERHQVIYQNDVQTLLSSIVGKREPSSTCFPI